MNWSDDRMLRECWYVAGWASEVTDTPVAKTVLGDDLVLFRSGGEIVVLSDRCSHRSLPLSMGRVVDGQLECGYHGLAFGADGGCVRVPGQRHAPSSAAVRRYPSTERWDWVWVWMGDPADADERTLPDHHDFIGVLNPRFRATRGFELHVNANYHFLNENLLDLSHVSFLHPGTVGTDAVAETPSETCVDGDVVKVWREVEENETPHLHLKTLGPVGPCVRTQTSTWKLPNINMSDATIVPAGTTSNQDTYWFRGVHMLTPINANETMYYFAFVRNFCLDDEWVDDHFRGAFEFVFAQDVEAVETIQRVVDKDHSSTPEVSVRADAGVLAARRILDDALRAERAGLPTT